MAVFQGLETGRGLFSRLFRFFRVNFTHFVGSFVASFVEIDHDSEQITCRRRIDERVHAETKNRLMRPASSSPDSFRRSSRQSSRQRFVQSFVIIRLRSFGATSRHVRLRSFGASSRQDLRGGRVEGFDGICRECGAPDPLLCYNSECGASRSRGGRTGEVAGGGFPGDREEDKSYTYFSTTILIHSSSPPPSFSPVLVHANLFLIPSRHPDDVAPYLRCPFPRRRGNHPPTPGNPRTRDPRAHHAVPSPRPRPTKHPSPRSRIIPTRSPDCPQLPLG